MLVQDYNEQITALMSKIHNYMYSNLNIKADLNEYYKTLNIPESNRKILNNYTINYIFERRLGADKKSIFDYVLTDLTDLTQEEKETLEAIKNSINGIFEVRKITKERFELFNIINEKLYIVTPLAKMTMFRNLSVGHFMMARLIKLNNEYLLYHIADHITYANRLTAFQIAVSRLAQNPSLLYFDNPQKLEELKESSKNIYTKFQDLFNADYIITSNKAVDTLITLLNDYIDNNEKPDTKIIEKNISPIKNNEYFDVSELNKGTNIFAEAKKGFSSQNKEYNVGLLANEKTGLIVVPFLDLLFEIIKSDSYKEIKNYDKCIENFVKSTKISPLPLQIVFNKYPEKFIPKINEILNTNYSSPEEILQQYKGFFIQNQYTTSTSTLYSSYAFQKLISVTQEESSEKEKFKNIGRNDPCPCGSGLKYKKCCGKAVQI